MLSQLQFALLLFVLFLTCSAVVSLGELDLDLVLPGDVLDAAAFGPHDGTVVALRDGHLHAHLGLLQERRQLGNNSTDGENTSRRVQEDYFHHFWM